MVELAGRKIVIQVERSNLLGRHIGQAATKLPVSNYGFSSTNIKIRQFDAVVITNQHVGRFDVSM